MNRFLRFVLLAIIFLVNIAAFAQSGKIDSANFFKDQTPFELSITTDLKNLMNKREQKAYQPAVATFRFADSSEIKEEIRLQTRGKFRLANCYMPPLMLNFKNPTSPKLRVLGKLKLVCGCATTNEDEQLIIKEYLAYKMYNMLTEKSFRVRLVRINYTDTRKKIKSYSQYGFLLEDVDDMAARNKCTEVEGSQFMTESTDRSQMTLIALFQYMIGNTDWSVPHYHNIKLMRPFKDSISLPYAVPYDLNHCGFVDAPYALPPEELGIENVRQRLYRGFPRSSEELESAISLFLKNKQKIWDLINNCAWLSNKHKKNTIGYLEDFYSIIENKRSIKKEFIDNARKQ
jgi:hypothetical protein